MIFLQLESVVLNEIKKDAQAFEKSKVKTKFAPVNVLLTILVLVSILLFVYVKTRSR